MSFIKGFMIGLREGGRRRSLFEGLWVMRSVPDSDPYEIVAQHDGTLQVNGGSYRIEVRNVRCVGDDLHFEHMQNGDVFLAFDMHLVSPDRMTGSASGTYFSAGGYHDEELIRVHDRGERERVLDIDRPGGSQRQRGVLSRLLASLLGIKGPDRWKELEEGMSRSQVESLLGPPDKLVKSGIREYWNYRRGSVTFLKDTGRVTGFFTRD
jgi:hypothetical protein